MLEVRDLVVRCRRGVFATPGPAAVNNASFSLPMCQTIGIVGEFGSGESSLLRAVLRLIPVASGQIRLNGQDFLSLKGQALRLARQGIGVVAQTPLLSLSPRLTIAQTLTEPMQAANLSRRSPHPCRPCAGPVRSACRFPDPPRTCFPVARRSVLPSRGR